MLSIELPAGWLQKDVDRARAKLDFLRATQSADWCLTCRPGTAHHIRVPPKQNMRMTCTVCWSSVTVEWTP